MMYKRYYGDFADIKKVAYHVEIWQESTTAFTAEEVTFSRDAVSLEWKELDKLEVIRSSSATIKLLCADDRKFTDLYTTSIKAVRADIYRAGSLYWSGTMDTEQYEEPYYLPKGYVVTLTFSDFGVLERLKYSAAGFVSINSFISSCVSQCGFSYGGITNYISTKLSSTDTADVFDELSVVSDNFYDEDGEADDLKKALEYVLQPFGAMIQQKAGHIYVFDYNTISDLTSSRVRWTRRNSTLSVDKVYNNAKITLSPYAKATLIDGTVDVDSVGNYPSIAVPLDESSGTGNLTGFTIYATDTGKGLTKSAGKFFRIDPDYSASEEAGIAWTIKHKVNGVFSLALSTSAASNSTSGTIFKNSARTYIAKLNDNSYSKYRLNISLDLLCSARMNPFEEASTNNEKGDEENLKKNVNIIYVPCRITLYDSSNAAICHFVNSNIKDSASIPVATGWVSGASTSWDDCYLAWYDTSDLQGGSPVGGWQTNKPTVGHYDGDLPTAYKRAGSGYGIVLPKINSGYYSGWIEVEIADGLYFYAYNGNGKAGYDEVRWLLFKDLSVKLVDKNNSEVKNEDEEIKAWLDKNAKEDYSIDTHIGTQDGMLPNAKGALFSASEAMIATLYRNGYSDRLENLLCGTLFSQFASRHNKLSGTVDLLPSFGVYSEKNTSGTFTLTSETQDLRANTSEVTMIAVDKDNYSGVEYNQT